MRLPLFALLVGGLLTSLCTAQDTISSLPGLSPLRTTPSQDEPRDEAQMIRHRLKKRVAMQWEDIKLEAAMSRIATELEITVEFDPRGLEEAGITPDHLLGPTVAKNRRGDHFLRSFLEPLNLSYLIKNGVLLITSIDSAQATTVTRTYVVRDLVQPWTPPAVDRPGSPVPVPAGTQVVWGASEDFPFSEDFDTLIQLVQENVSPDSWLDNGGQGTISGFRGLLIVSQCERMHDEVEALLKEIRIGERSASGAIIDIEPE